MAGKVRMVTGSSSGIGKATAASLAGIGATVMMVCRDEAREKRGGKIQSTKGVNEKLDLMLQLSGAERVRSLFIGHRDFR